MSSKIELMSKRITEINELIAELEEDKERIKNKICTAKCSETKQATKCNIAERDNMLYAEKCEEENRLTDELIDIKSNLEQLINLIPDARHRRIIKYIYIDGMTIKQVADTIGYNYDYLSCQLIPKILG